MKKFCIAVICCLYGMSFHAQSLTIEDYERAVSYAYDHYHNKTAFNLHTEVQWMSDSNALVFNHYNKEGKTYQLLDFESYEANPLFDHSKVSELLNIDEGAEINISDIEIRGDSLNFEYRDTSYLLLLSDYRLTVSETEEPATQNPNERRSPDGKWIAFTKDYNLFLRSTTDGQEYQLTADGKKDYEYGTYYGWFDRMEGENGERPERFYVDWSPDSRYLRANLVDLQNASKMYMLDFSQDDLFRPTLHSYYRGSPGDTNMVLVTSKFFDANAQKLINVDLPTKTHINALSTRWTKDGKLIALDVKRGFQENQMLEIDLKNEAVRTLFKEVSETNIDDFEYRYLSEQHQILFFSQRSGWRHVYLYDIASDDITALTSGDFVVNDLVYTDEENGILFIMVSGKDPSMNPYHQQLYRVTMNGDMSLLTPEKMHHEISFSPDGKHFVDNYSTVQDPTRTVLRSTLSGEVLTLLTQADVGPLQDKGWSPPQTFSTIAKDGKTKIYGAIWKPTNFDLNKKYPVIDHSYTGPHTQVFPKSFNRAFGNQALAELGFVVVAVDGLGTTGRSKAFANHSYKNMGNNLEDHILAIKELASKYEWIDIDRVGIFGHSAGGYDAGHAVLAFPDFYKVAVASSGDHDFRMEKAWWPEMYMGWPVDSTYHEVSNITLAPNLKGKLLLVHGNMDDNVNVSATYKLAEALIKADKEFDLLILPSQRHGYQGNYRKYFIKKRWNYFVEHLLDEEPIWNFDWD